MPSKTKQNPRQHLEDETSSAPESGTRDSGSVPTPEQKRLSRESLQRTGKHVRGSSQSNDNPAHAEEEA
jgi:hypothetical protein